MGSFKYDITALVRIEGIDVTEGLKNFGGYQEYYDKLTDFTENACQYLRAYTPAVIIHSEDMRRDFLGELETTRRIVSAIGAKDASEDLKNIQEAVFNNITGLLTNALVNFHADMEILAEQIVAARISDDKIPSYGPAEKPVIFAVDDKSEILSTITNMLSNHYKVIAVTNGKIALKALQMHAPALFLLDIEMPVMSGYELAKEIRAQARFKNTPILFITAQSTRNAVLNAVMNGGNDYILKPVDQGILLEKIELHLKRPR